RVGHPQRPRLPPPPRRPRHPPAPPQAALRGLPDLLGPPRPAASAGVTGRLDRVSGTDQPQVAEGLREVPASADSPGRSSPRAAEVAGVPDELVEKALLDTGDRPEHAGSHGRSPPCGSHPG